VCEIMKSLRFIFVTGLLLGACAVISAAGGSPPDKSSPPATNSILPKQFGGWQAADTIRKSKDPAAADPVNAALLKEYGLTDFESATYTRDDGHKLNLKAARFADASGAYGAFTYYKMPQMLTEKIGDEGASLNERVLFFRGNVLVDAVFEKLSAMSAAELRELAANLPLVGGASGNLPSLPAYLPKPGYVKNTIKYVVGPVGLGKTGAPLQTPLVDFDAGAEVVLGTYQTSVGDATLMLISYPTPQIAAERLRRIEAAHQQSAQPQPGSPALLDIAPVFDKRTGPIVVVASGPLSQSEARALLGSVNYEADVTWNENTHFTKRDNLANLLFNIIVLCGILIAFSAVAGIAFGGIRIMVKRVLPDRVFDRREDVEFISLHLSEGDAAAQRKVSSSIENA
jgi:hypothetical protein